MGRPLRLKVPDVTYHITSRTNGKRLFMQKKKDRKALCKILRRVQLKYSVIIYGFTPMGNHFHLLAKMDQKSDLSQFICEFKTAYAKYYNTKYNLSGHFWGDRFKSTIIQDDRHMLACLRYIDRNPVRAGLAKGPGHWAYTSYHFYAYGQKHEVLDLCAHPVYLELSTTATGRYQAYIHYIENDDRLSDALPGYLNKQQVFGSVEFVRQYM